MDIPNITKKAQLAIALSYCTFLKTEEKLFLRKTLDNLQALTVLSIEDISIMVGRRLNPRSCKIQTLPLLAEKACKLMTKYRIHMHVFDEADFPPLLREIPDPPFSIYYRGQLPPSDIPAISMVGTRRPTGSGINTALRLAEEFAHADIPVVSGLARGIDAFSHKGALNGDGHTTAVLACGVDQFYPLSNRRLAGRILEQGGGILSEYPPGELPLPYRFPQRNRVISGLSRSVIVVEAPKKSGALITADFALEQGRDVYVCTDVLHSLQNTGGKNLAEDGAPALHSAHDVLQEWERSSTASAKEIHSQQQMPLF